LLLEQIKTAQKGGSGDMVMRLAGVKCARKGQVEIGKLQMV